MKSCSFHLCRFSQLFDILRTDLSHHILGNPGLGKSKERTRLRRAHVNRGKESRIATGIVPRQARPVRRPPHHVMESVVFVKFLLENLCCSFAFLVDILGYVFQVVCQVLCRFRHRPVNANVEVR